MKVTELRLKGAYRIEIDLLEDNRGFFFEWFNVKSFQELTNIEFYPVQFNCSKSKKGVLRGMHFQKEPFAQAKVIGINKGSFQDVIVDLRNESPTYGQWHSEEFTDEDKKKLYVPKGFAHGFLVTSAEAEIFYAIDNYYHPASESGIMFNDPSIGIEWQLEEKEIILSDKDKNYDFIKV